MEHIGIKDIIDILLVATLLYYLYKIMKESGTLNIFVGVLSFIVVWVVTSEILEMRLIGSILDKFMSIGLLILVILFQDQIKRFLVAIGSHKRWQFLKNILKHRKPNNEESSEKWVMPIVYACMNLARSKTGALIVVQQDVPLDNYEKTGDIINANINSRLLENIFFKNSPLHDGAVIIADNLIKSAGCILPVSHDTTIPRSLGLRHRSALGIAQDTDAVAIVVSEETGYISVAHKGALHTKLTSTELKHTLSQLSSEV